LPFSKEGLAIKVAKSIVAALAALDMPITAADINASRPQLFFVKFRIHFLRYLS
jgi:hypothetical protein